MKKLTCLHLFPWNSLFIMAFSPYIIGDDQKPHNHHFFILPISIKQRQKSSVILMKERFFSFVLILWYLLTG